MNGAALSFPALPEDWELLKLGALGRFTASGIDKKTVEGEPLVSMVNYTDVYGNNSLTIDGHGGLMRVSCPPEKKREHSLKKGDLLFTPSSETKDEIGASVVVTEDLPETVYSYHLIRFRSHGRVDLDLDFRKYMCNHRAFLWQLEAASKGTTRQILTRDDFRSAYVAIPPAGAQQAIASFLDRETTKIDTLIEKKQRLLELLEEKRTALITRAVTKGLDPDVPMKDSGVDWIGEIPEHWEVVRFGRFISHLDQGWSPVADDYQVEEGEWGVLKLSAVKNGTFHPFEHKRLRSTEDLDEALMLRAGDLLVTRSNTPDLVGDACIVPDSNLRLIPSDLVYRIRLKQSITAEFSLLWFLSGPHRAQW